MFSGAEQVVRTIDRERDGIDVAILDVSRVDDIDDVARALLAGPAPRCARMARTATSSTPTAS